MPINNLISSAPVGGLIDRMKGLGRVIYVSSVYGRDNNGGTIDSPVATLVRALAKLASANNVRNNDDTVVLLPDHSESIATATALNISRAGVSIVGIGKGVRQPQISLITSTAATVTVSGAGVTIENVRISSAIAGCLVALTVSAANLSLVGVKIDETTGTIVKHIATGSTTSNVCDGLELKGCKLLGAAAANDITIHATGTNDSWVMEDCYVNVNVNGTLAILQTAATKNLTNLKVKRNDLVRLGASGACIINLVGTANSGMVADNRIKCAVPTIAAIVGVLDVTGCGLNQNYAIGEDDKSGILVPAADAT